jgi:eukaryotic-like serine/threonine-protein kinase
VLLAGEPGIGKTRLAEELEPDALQRGARVLWGRCYEGEGAPPFWPWIEILRAAARTQPADQMQADLGEGTAQLLRLVPEVSRLVPARDGTAPDEPAERPDPAQARFRLFEAITAMLTAQAERRPTVLVLDDLHWADASSLPWWGESSTWPHSSPCSRRTVCRYWRRWTRRKRPGW